MKKDLLSKTLVMGVVVLFIGVGVAGSSPSLSISKSQKFTFDGNTLYVGGSEPGNYSKIQDAIDDASDGDTVFVYDDSSPYYEWEILIDKSINLIGENRDTTVIDGNDNFCIYRITKDRVNISGFSMINSGYGIFTEDNSNIIISDNHFINCFYGIGPWEAGNSYVISNTFREFYIAVQCFSGGITISNNIIISSTEMWDRMGDISCWGGNFIITNNTFISDIKWEGQQGLHLESVSDSIIDGNEFSGYYGSAIDLYRDNHNNIISHNNITNNDCGIVVISSFSHSNKITNNNFINNRQDVLFSSLTFNKIWDGNYWDEWIGLKYPLLGFLPYLYSNSLGFLIDWNPAKEPYDINVNVTQGCGIE